MAQDHHDHHDGALQGFGGLHDGFLQASGPSNRNGNNQGQHPSFVRVTQKPTPTRNIGGARTETPNGNGNGNGNDHGQQQQQSSAGFLVGAPVQGSQQPHHFEPVTTTHAPFQTHSPEVQGLQSTSSRRPILGTPMQNSRAASATPSYATPATSAGYLLSSSAALSSFSFSSSPSSTAAASGSGISKSSGVSSGAKVGIALAVIAGVALIAGLAFFFYRQRRARREGHQRLDDEKYDGNFPKTSISSHVSVRRPNASAPRLSLRPVTEMFPGQETSNNGLIGNSAAHARNLDVGNPFGDQAASGQGAMSMNSNAPSLAPLAAPAALAVRGPNNGRTSPNNGSRSPGLGGAMGPPSSNVHRVQLDFKPSMDDELELRAGEVVRLLHEYDDGWALCVRLDRSQQGVVPRTCLSKLPLKPRPGPPPGMRGPPRGPPGARGSPRHSPQGSSNSFGPMNPEPRRMSPPSSRMRSYSNAAYGPDRSTSPGPYGQYQESSRSRSNSAAHSARRITPPSPLNPASTSPPREVPSRKPVPGQAM